MQLCYCPFFLDRLQIPAYYRWSSAFTYARLGISCSSSTHHLQARSVHSLCFGGGRGGGGIVEPQRKSLVVCRAAEHIMIMERLAPKKYRWEPMRWFLVNLSSQKWLQNVFQVCCSLKRLWVLAGDNRVLFFNSDLTP